MEEYFDVVDITRKSLNKTLKRGSKLNENEFNTGAEIWIFNDKCELLLTKRSPEKSHPLQWECPGGAVIASETSIDAIKREIEEEIGLSLNCEINLLETHLYKHQFVDIFSVNLNIDLSTLKLQKEEVCDAKFVNKETFMQMCKNNQTVPSLIERYNLIKSKIIF